MLEIVAVPAFADNYLWLIHDPDSNETVAVDPGDPAPVLAEAKRRGWSIGQLWNTHWHADHSGGNQALRETGATIYGPAGEAGRSPALDVLLKEGDRVRFGNHEAEVWEVPGHTLGHIAFVLRDAGVAFVGDTLFAMGCGRLFEGTPEQMFGSLRRIASLPADTRLYCAHEYTLSNARFAAHADPTNAAIAERLKAVEQARRAGAMTVPTTVAEELATNVFVRASDAGEFARLRQSKDAFR
ncbi:MAG: hydroxyacylglutathione hydrolase [Sphingomicrobium sp.]